MVALIPAALLTLSGALQANHFGVNETEITLDGFKRNVVMMHIPDIHIGHHRGKDYLAKIVAETNRHKPDIVLINGDLMLSGHTHAGQMFPGTLLASVFFQYVKGLYQEGGTKVFVSRGVGTYGPRLRLGTANEIDLIRLQAK